MSCSAHRSQQVVFSTKARSACRSARRSQQVFVSCFSKTANLVQIYLLADLSRLERPGLLLPNNEPVLSASLDEHGGRDSARIRDPRHPFVGEDATENYRQQQGV